MKKLFIGLFMLLVSSVMFAKTFDNNGEVLDKFFQYGNYIKIELDDSNVQYAPKSAIRCINADEDEIEIFVTNEKNDVFKQGYSVKKYKIELDENSNLIIKKK